MQPPAGISGETPRLPDPAAGHPHGIHHFAATEEPTEPNKGSDPGAPMAFG